MITALTSHTDILINIIRYTPPRSLVYLYSISAPFHYIMDSHFTQFILSNTKTWAPGAEFFYPWRCYRELCIHDPAMRRRSYEHRENFVDRRTGRKSDEWNAEQQHEAIALHGADFDIKPVPSLRWLKMVVYREFVSREIVAWLAVKGHRTPVRATIDAVKVCDPHFSSPINPIDRVYDYSVQREHSKLIKTYQKMWFLIDIPVSAPRVALIHNTAYFTNQTLYALTMLFLKLDMYHTDPICYTGGEAVMREYLLQERSLTTLWNHLRDADGTTRLDTVRLYVKHGYRRPLRHGPETLAEQIENDEKAKMPIMGIPAHLVGRWGYECWGLGGQRLIRPDELVLREGIRRGMEMQKMWIRMMLWGYLDKDLKDVEKVEKENVVLSLIRRRKKMEQKEREARWAREAEEIDEGGASGAGACVQEENDKMEMD